MSYFEVNALNHSLLKQFRYSPRHYLVAKVNNTIPTKAMGFGTLAHGLLLEDISKDIIIEIDANRNTKKYKEWYASVDKSKIIVSQNDFDIANKMIDNLSKKKSFTDFYFYECGLEKEKEIYFKKDGHDCKAKLDIVSDEFIIDIKTTNNIDAKSFFNSIITYDYHTQMAWYLEASGNINKYIVAMEKSEPYDSIVYYMPRELLEIGHDLNQERFEIYKYCMETNDWYGYEDKIHDIKIPDWFLQNRTIKGEII